MARCLRACGTLSSINHSLIRVVLLLAMSLPALVGRSQVYHASDTYPNGRKKFKGKFVVCSTRDPKVPFVEIFEKRKFGKWIAYNQNGTLREIRHYTSKGKDCKTKIKKVGEWRYFNDNGELYLTETYENDTLVYSEVDVYDGSLRLGVATRTHMGLEQIPLSKNQDTTNLIMNPSFDQYLFKPIQIMNDGQDQLQDLVPYWYSPDGASPDYFNGYRSVMEVPDNIHPDITMDKNNGYVGLMLYLGEKLAPENLASGLDTRGYSKRTPDYNESIQSKLVRALTMDRTYCFRMRALLSINAGYSINRLGILFTDNPVFYSYLKAPTKPTFSFTSSLNNDSKWETLCKTFVATGDEAYITLGRLNQSDETSVFPREPHQFSELDVNRSAYYLIDDLQLFEVETPEMCGCSIEEPLVATSEGPINFEFFDEEQVQPTNRFILSNILFDFDEAEIKESFHPELNKLLSYLKNNISVSIAIKAFTDNEGPAEYNLKLSKKRAEVISSWLINNGVSEERIYAGGYGSSDPIANNTSEANRAKNRRVEIVLIRE